MQSQIQSLFIALIEEEKEARSPRSTPKRMMETTRRGVITNTLLAAAGFFVLLIASIFLLRRFGFLSAITMLVSSCGALVLLPSVVLFTRTRFIQNRRAKE